MRYIMRRKIPKRMAMSVVCAMSALLSVAQTESASDTVHFRLRYVVNTTDIDSSFADNTSRMMDMEDFLHRLRNDKNLKVTDVKFRGTASPDGSYEFNVWLSENRLRAFKKLVRSYVSIPDNLIHADTSTIPWDEFRAKVAASDMDYRDEILDIIDEGQRLVPYTNDRHIDARLLKLKALHGGRAWELLKSPILSDLRYGDAVFTFTRIHPKVVAQGVMPTYPINPPKETILPPPVFPEPEPLPLDTAERWMPRFHIKTNLVALAMLSANLGLEFDMGRHWSITLPVSYGAMDWFKSTIKFRNFTVRPEIRYWFRHRTNDGFFIGPHFELCYFNYALDGEYRYQDYEGRTPALGGGLSFGFRTPISRNKRWRMEFGVGAGAYALDYSLFRNTPDVRDGEWVERRKETYIGLDNVALTIAYSINLKKSPKKCSEKGGKR